MTTWEVTYNSYEIGEASGKAYPTLPTQYSESFEQVSVSQTFMLIGTGSTRAVSIADYQVKEAEMLLALNAAEGDLLIRSGGASGTIFRDFKPSEGTVGSVFAGVDRSLDSRDAPNQKAWTLTYVAEMPADEASKEFRRTARIALSFSGSRRRFLSFNGTYTFSEEPVNTLRRSLDTYFALFDTWAAGEIARIGGTFKKQGEPVLDEDQQGTLLSFSVAYEEVVWQSTNSQVFNEVLRIDRDSTLLEQPLRLGFSASYSADVTIEGVAPPQIPEDDLSKFWLDVLKPIVRTKILSALADGNGIVIFEREGQSSVHTDSGIGAFLSGIVVANAYTYLRNASLSTTFEASRRRVFVIAGAYQTDDVGSVGAAAKYATGIDALEAAFLPIPIGQTELVEERAPTEGDDEDSIFRFSRQRREIIYSVYAPGVIAETFSFGIDGAYAIGDPARLPPMFGTIRYTTAVDKDISPQGNHFSLYKQIRRTLVAKAEAIFGKSLIIQTESMDNSPNGLITCSMRVFFPGFSSQVIEFLQVSSYFIAYNNTRLRRQDGEHATYNTFSPGADVRASVSVRVKTVGGTLNPQPITTAPSKPPKGWPVSRSGIWVHDNDGVRVTGVKWGSSPLGSPNRKIIVVTQEGNRAYTWEAKGSKKVVPVSIPDIKIPASSAITVRGAI